MVKYKDKYYIADFFTKNIESNKAMAEIKISDLSIGDWVCYESTVRTLPMKVLEIGEKDAMCDGQIYITGETEAGRIFCEVTELKPIPLSPEILEKNGLERGEYSEIREYNEWEIGEWDNPPYVSVKLEIDRQVIRVTNRGRDMFIADKEVYVHQLQHALRLAGVEKEIEV